MGKTDRTVLALQQIKQAGQISPTYSMETGQGHLHAGRSYTPYNDSDTFTPVSHICPYKQQEINHLHKIL